ncbi:lysozyme family protein [uncultured Planococcus sp.]|uniref:lysozyme family protein n=1 Tax=uncultured Planococcus sp. TaxID=337815 RepID=UPI00260DDA16|nr:lysozyme family protein [uncultured Planococcus sp.]
MPQPRSKAQLAKTALKLALLKYNPIGLQAKLIIAGSALAIVIILIFTAGIFSMFSSPDDGSSGDGIGAGVGPASVSPEVAQYRDAISSELAKYDMEGQTELLLALMMQESGGKGNDPMQASESKCGSIGCITDPDESISYGVEHFVSVFKSAKKDVKLTLQSYNFGSGFIDYVLKNGGSYTKELAISFSQLQYQKLKHTGIYKCNRPEAIQHSACYGDIGYVEAVLKYLPSASTGNSAMIAGDLAAPVRNTMRVTSNYGWRNIGAGPEHHDGIDLGCSEADSIHSVKDGTIVFAGMYGGYGNVVTVQHAANSFTTYAHLSRISVQVNQKVEGGNKVGMCGNTGRSFGSHLHFEIKTQMWGGYMDPAPFLFKEA